MATDLHSSCIMIFWAWVGWFPFLVYSTTFVGEVLKRYDTSRDVTESGDKLGDIARVGSMALVLFSLVSLVASVTLPSLVESPLSDQRPMSTHGMLGTLVKRIEPYKLDLCSAWVFGHVSFAGLMFLTLFAASVSFATLLVALSGV